ncbi:MULTISPECIES: ParB/RepB/Spo0J family partition protein [Persicobacter]|uniref:Chromosome partitioning protein ParB n=1 Tax=Persicobacter diffluens TaxID=981 RepID=A0AAN4VVY3_9BACT|nr:ParB/RepB/Spo0J family partition protein [Persicobacter sp. CCB-QB2]GJM60397.1 chromosome partitioning protein ParB [Persicobacter diffluens]
MSQKRKNALGRGLGALLEDSKAVNFSKAGIDAEPLNTPMGINEIAVDQIEVNPFQPRTDFDPVALQELADSIKVQGIIQPITLREVEAGRFQIISGERRYQAAQLAGLKHITSYIRQANDQQMLEMALIENIQREDLNAIEIALCYQRLVAECGLKQEELGSRIGKNRTTVNNYMRLLKLPPEVQVAVRDRKISMGHARAIINIDNIDLQLSIFKKIIAEDLSVRKVEQLVRELANGKGAEGKAKSLDPERAYQIKRIQSRLSSHFGTKVAIASDDKDKGFIKIPFVSAEDFNRIMDILDL